MLNGIGNDFFKWIKNIHQEIQSCMFDVNLGITRDKISQKEFEELKKLRDSMRKENGS